MKILADENIPYVREAFAALGAVETIGGRAITSERARDADILLIRSITRVNRALLDGSRVRFVGSATIGEDHVDKSYLAERGIAFASAPGCNANSVGDYIVSALLALAESFDLDLSAMSLGVIGVGNVGRNVAAKAAALGLTCVWNDPPLARDTGDVRYRPLEDALACDIVTLHVPLTKTGPDATVHMADASFFRRLNPGAFFINSSRGAVVDESALMSALREGRVKACVLDVWENEPDIDVELLNRAFIGTPHIAGYSFDGKVNGTRQIYEAACRFLGRPPTWDPAPLLPPPDCPEVRVDGSSARPQDEVRKAVFAVYDVRRDDAAMRKIRSEPPDRRRAFFDHLRKNYPRRRECFLTRAVVTPPNDALASRLRGLGFQCPSDRTRAGGREKDISQ
mgnify:CR=1 FL=1